MFAILERILTDSFGILAAFGLDRNTETFKRCILLSKFIPCVFGGSLEKSGSFKFISPMIIQVTYQRASWNRGNGRSVLPHVWLMAVESAAGVHMRAE